MNVSHLCIYIGTNSIKVLEKDYSGKVLKWGYLERTGGTFHTNIQPLNEKEAGEFLKQLLDKMQVGSKEAVLALPSFLTFTAVVDSPDSKHVPAALGTFQFGAAPIGTGKFFLAAIPNDVIGKYQRIFNSLEINIARIEPAGVPLARVFSQGSDPVVIVHPEKYSTSFVVASSGQVYFVAHTAFGIDPQANVIINKAKEIAKLHGIKKIVSSEAFSVNYGL